MVYHGCDGQRRAISHHLEATVGNYNDKKRQISKKQQEAADKKAAEAQKKKLQSGAADKTLQALKRGDTANYEKKDGKTGPKICTGCKGERLFWNKKTKQWEYCGLCGGSGFAKK
jgi:hypothetical protein